MTRSVYEGRKTAQISFPLGGIGTGSIGLAGNGGLIDWEIFNRPNKGGLNGFSHFAIKAEQKGKVVDARVLNGDMAPPFTGAGVGVRRFGFGVDRAHLTGLPHFESTVFRGEFPTATIDFKSRRFPGHVQMTAFNPFIPLNDKDSGLPAAFFEIEVHNTTGAAMTYTVAGTLANPLPANNLHRTGKVGKMRFLHLCTDGVERTQPGYGDLTLATDASDVDAQAYWFRGRWFDNLEVYWRDLTTPGALPTRRYPPKQAGNENAGTLAARVQIPAGGRRRIRFVIAWNFPNCENHWNREDAIKRAKAAGISPVWRNYYATLWKDSKTSARYALDNWARLYKETLTFKQALFASSLPDVAIEAVSANISILKSATVLRLEDGTFYGWEGCCAEGGCCEGSCTHVWNYAQALPFLFPALERSMREADYRYNQQANGGMPFRIQLPLGIQHPGGRSCADGLFGGVLKTYRDWKISGDTDWLRRVWPAVKKSIEFAWAPDNEDRWDPDKTGVLWGRQHHTLDMELFGPSSWLTGFYLGALKAGAEMAAHLGDASAEEFTALFEKGKAWADKHLFNGEYYHQLIDLNDRSIPARFNALGTYWNTEHKEIKYQIGEGCEIDQLVAQWHANLYGLGDLFDAGQTKKALRAVFRHNFQKPMRDVYNPCRVYSLNDEGGLVICDWPDGVRKPRIPLTYAQEAMHGFEYAAAIHMIQAGWVKQGMKVVEAIRERYDGERRNPWNEFECGSNYARSMASYALLNAFSGFEFDMGRGMIGFAPIQAEAGRFRCFWSLDNGWGEFELTPRGAELRVLYGTLRLRSLRLGALRQCEARRVTLAGKRVAFERQGVELLLSRPACLRVGKPLRVTLAACRTSTTV